MYCTVADMQTRFGEQELIQLTDRNREGELDLIVLNAAIADASAEIDGYLAGRYALPLPAAPKVLTLYACDIARYRLYEDGAYEQITERYKAALRYLRDLAEGKIQLSGVDDSSREDDLAIFTPSRQQFHGGAY